MASRLVMREGHGLNRIITTQSILIFLFLNNTYSVHPHFLIPVRNHPAAGFTTGGLPVGLEFLGRAYDESTLIKLAYGFEQGTLFRQAPKSTPALPGETIVAVPEPSIVVALGIVSVGLLTARPRRRSKPINLQ